MKKITNFYLDDSGTRHPDRTAGDLPRHGCDYFALGGILANDEDEKIIRELHAEFCNKWAIDYPLHSYEIRNKTEHFAWLGDMSTIDFEQFMQEIHKLLVDIPVIGLACVVDRPGNKNRYEKKHGRDRWSLCRTAFSIVIERACKFAIANERVLRIFPEECNKKDDQKLNEYYINLKNDGQPFEQKKSNKYNPLDAEGFKTRLYDFKIKKKSSVLVQLADVYLWPMAMGGYHKSNRTYKILIGENKIIDATLDSKDVSILGVKYSCFENVDVKS